MTSPKTPSDMLRPADDTPMLIYLRLSIRTSTKTMRTAKIIWPVDSPNGIAADVVVVVVLIIDGIDVRFPY